VKPYTLNPQPFLADKHSAMQGYVTSERLPSRSRRPHAESLSPRRLWVQQLFDADRDAPRSGRSKGDLVQRFVDASIIRLDELSLP